MSKLIKTYLANHSLAELKEEHGVAARPSSCMTKFSLNYDQIIAKSGDPVAEHCRGMIIRPSDPVSLDNWENRAVGDIEIIAWPMNRFYNHGDPSAHMVDWDDSQLQVFEKLDGTCCILYWDPLKNDWHVATRAVPEADLPIRKDDMQIGDMTFSGLFWLAASETIRTSGMKIFENGDVNTWKEYLNKKKTHVFELTSPHNRIVVKYDEPRITLLACRSLITGDETPIEREAQTLGIPIPQTWTSLKDPVTLSAFVNSADPAKLEGAVVLDRHGNRVKVKSMAWVLSSRAKDLVTVSRRSALEAIVLDKIDDVLPLVEKDIAAELEWMRDSLVKYCKTIDVNFAKWVDEAAGSRKSFASFVMLGDDWTPAYFNLWEKRAPNALAWVRQQGTAQKLTASTLDVILKKLEMFRVDSTV